MFLRDKIINIIDFSIGLLHKKKNDWDTFIENVTIELIKIDKVLNLEDKQKIFKNNIGLIEFEPTSFCNRKCSFCPNSFIDRTGGKLRFDIELYKKIIEELSIIKYDQKIRFARYSEPLYDFEFILQLIEIAKKSLGNVFIDIITNGDYLSHNKIDQLKKSGLSALRISIYPDGNNGKWVKEKAQQKIEHISKKILLPIYKYREYPKAIMCEYQYSGMDVIAWSHDFEHSGYDRGGSIGSLIDSKFVRESPCVFPFTNLTIDYNGYVMPCCNLRSDFEDHKKYILAKLDMDNYQSIYDIYFNPQMILWRKNMVSTESKVKPCATCRQKLLTDKKRLRILQKKLESIEF